MLGVINFMKPPGMSSAQAVAFIKRLSGLKAGHAGTLDPEAAGVLPVLLGRATRIADYLMAGRKVYLAEIAFGQATDTQDAHGQVTQQGDCFPDEQRLRAILPRFTGSISQLPPQYSALKIGGLTAYKLARQGKRAALEPRQTEVHSIELIRAMPDQGYLLRVACGKGTYIRTLCHDIGEALGCPSHMRLLIREESGGLQIKDAVTPEELAQAGREGFARYLLPVDQALGFLPRMEAPMGLIHLLAGGVRLSATDPRLGGVRVPEGTFRLYAGEHFIGLFSEDEGSLRARTMLYAPAEGVKRADS